jgi:hypothetical protein
MSNKRKRERERERERESDKERGYVGLSGLKYKQWITLWLG